MKARAVKVNIKSRSRYSLFTLTHPFFHHTFNISNQVPENKTN